MLPTRTLSSRAAWCKVGSFVSDICLCVCKAHARLRARACVLTCRAQWMEVRVRGRVQGHVRLVQSCKRARAFLSWDSMCCCCCCCCCCHCAVVLFNCLRMWRAGDHKLRCGAAHRKPAAQAPTSAAWIQTRATRWECAPSRAVRTRLARCHCV